MAFLYQPRSRLCSVFSHFYQRFETLPRVNLSPLWTNNCRRIFTAPKSVSTFSVCCRQKSPLTLQVQNYTTILGALESTGSVKKNRVGSPSSQSLTQVRHVVKYSKLGKRKTVKSVAKRFRRTGSGKLKYWPAGKVHNMLAKSRNRRRKLRKAKYVTKTQLKILNKMISGW